MSDPMARRTLARVKRLRAKADSLATIKAGGKTRILLRDEIVALRSLADALYASALEPMGDPSRRVVCSFPSGTSRRMTTRAALRLGHGSLKGIK